MSGRKNSLPPIQSLRQDQAPDQLVLAGAGGPSMEPPLHHLGLPGTEDAESRDRNPACGEQLLQLLSGEPRASLKTHLCSQGTTPRRPREDEGGGVRSAGSSWHLALRSIGTQIDVVRDELQPLKLHGRSMRKSSAGASAALLQTIKNQQPEGAGRRQLTRFHEATGYHRQPACGCSCCSAES